MQGKRGNLPDEVVNMSRKSKNKSNHQQYDRWKLSWGSVDYHDFSFHFMNDEGRKLTLFFDFDWKNNKKSAKTNFCKLASFYNSYGYRMKILMKLEKDYLYHLDDWWFGGNQSVFGLSCVKYIKPDQFDLFCKSLTEDKFIKKYFSKYFNKLGIKNYSYQLIVDKNEEE